MTVRGRKIPKWVTVLAGGVPVIGILSLALGAFVDARAVTKKEFDEYKTTHKAFGEAIVERIDDRLDNIDRNVELLTSYLLPKRSESGGEFWWEGPRLCVMP